MPFSPFQKRTFKQFGSTVLFTSLVLTGLVTTFRQVGMMEEAELTTYDRFMRLKPADPMDERILVVGITEADIQALQQYPIEDGTLAKTLEKLVENNPRAIGIDIARDVPQGPPEGRERLTQVLQANSNISAGCLLSSEREPGIGPPPGADPDIVSFVDFSQDPDGKVRRTILASKPIFSAATVGETHLCNNANIEEEMLSFGLTLALLYLEQESIYFGLTGWGAIAIGDTVVSPLSRRSGGYTQQDVDDYQIMINYRAAKDAVRSVSLSDVLEDKVEADWIEDRIVLIGYTADIANDVLLTPFKETLVGRREMSGVLVHAQAASQILGATLDNRPLIHSWPEAIEILLIGFSAIAGGTLVFYNRRLIVVVLGCGALVAAYWSLCFALFVQGLWLPLVPPIVAFVITATSVAVLDRANQGGYAQAIYEQLRSQRGSSMPTDSQNQQRPYLEDLVHRARMIRQQREGESIWESDAIAHIEEDPDSVRFDSPEIQTLYEKIKTKAQRDWELERTTVEALQAQQQRQAQEQRIQTLIGKARIARANSNGPSGGSQV